MTGQSLYSSHGSIVGLLSKALIVVKATLLKLDDWSFMCLRKQVLPDGQCENLRFNIEGPAKLKVGTSMPKLAQLAGFNN